MVKAEHRIWVGESPSVRGLGETGDYVQGCEGEGGARRGGFGWRRTSRVRGDDAGTSGGGNGLHTATVLDT